MAIVYGANYGRPTLDLNFAKNKSLIDTLTGRNLITFSRSQTAREATYVGADGLIQTAASGAARFDHNPATGESLGLLVEEARTNLNTYSEQFNNWTVHFSSALLIQNHGISPNGTLTATLVYPSGSESFCLIYKNIGGGSGTTATVTIYAKAAGKTWINLFDSGGAVFASFDLFNGVVGYANATITASIASAGNGWYRCSVIQSSSAAYQLGFDVTDGSGTRNVTANGTDGVLVWGAQLEAGAFPTSYIPTTSATVTRAADVASMTGTNFSSWYRQDEGTLFASVSKSQNVSSEGGIFSVNDGTGNTIIRIAHFASQNYMTVRVGGVNSLDTSIGALSQGTPYKNALAYKAGSISAVLNGGSLVTSSGAVPSTLTTAQIGVYPGTGTTNSTIARLTYYPVRLSDAQLQALTR